EYHPLYRLGVNLLHQRRYQEAERVLRESAAAYARENQNSSSPHTTLIQGRLGAALAGQGRFVEAEHLLLARHEYLSHLGPFAVTDPYSESVENLRDIAALYTSWGKREKASEWEAKRTAAIANKEAREFRARSFKRARCYELLEDFERAEQEWRKAR